MKQGKKIIIYTLLFFFVSLAMFLIFYGSSISRLSASVSSLNSNVTFAEAIQEVADAYIKKSNTTNGGITEGGYGGLIQYDTFLKKFNFSPEDAQLDNLYFTVCSNAMYNIYKEAFDISLPYDTDELTDYAKYRSYSNGSYNAVNTDEVKYASNVYKEQNSEYKNLLELENKDNRTEEEDQLYHELKTREASLFQNLVTYDKYGLAYAKTIQNTASSSGWLKSNGSFNTSSTSAKNGFYDLFAEKYAPNGELRVGDLIVFRYINDTNPVDVTYLNNTKKIAYPSGEAGHVLMIYSIEEVNGAKEITMVEADNSSTTTLASDKNLSSTCYVNGNALQKCYINSHDLNAAFNPLENYIFKKSNFYTRAYHFITKQNPSESYLTKIAVIRPLEGKENLTVVSGGNLRQLTNVNNEFLNGKTITSATVDRLIYKGISIFKNSTVEGESTEVVMPGDTITYTITIKNSSNNSYSLPDITENYDTRYVGIDTASLTALKTSGIATRAAAKSGVITIEGVTVPANSERSFSYNVIVKGKEKVPINTKIVSTGSIGDIKNATITKTLGYRLSGSDLSNFLNSINSVTVSTGAQSASASKTIGLKYVDDVLTNFYNNKLGSSETSMLFNDTNYSTKVLYANNNSSILSYNDEDMVIEKNNRSYLKALNQNSFTDYSNIYDYFHANHVVGTLFPPEKKWYGSNYCSSNCLNINDYWYSATSRWDERKVNYPTSALLNNGDIIWVMDSNNYSFIYLYYNGKLYSGYNDTMTTKKGSNTFYVNSLTQFDSNGNASKIYDYSIPDPNNSGSTISGSVYNNLPRFLSNLETYRAYAIFRPLNYIGIQNDEIREETYTIKYNLNGGTVGSANPTTYGEYTPSITINNPSKTGYTFTGWTGTNLSTPTVNLTINKGSTGNRTYTANYSVDTFSVEFYDEGTLVDTIQKEYNSTLNNNETPVVSKEGYTFTYWSLDGETTSYDFSSVITGNIRLNSNYVIQGRTVTFNDENRITDVNINWGDTVTPISDQGKTGYTFSHWSLQRNGTAFDFSTPITNPTTLYAVYTVNTYTITYNLDGGTATNPANYNVESDDFTLNNPSKTGYTFTGWTGTDYTDETETVTVTKGTIGNKTFEAHYTPIEYDITYNLDGGSLKNQNPNIYTIETNTFTLNNPSKAGYSFVGWKIGNNDPVSSYTINQGTTGDIELTAIYEINQYTITFINENETYDTQTVNYGSEVSAPSNPSKSGYTFKHWSLEENDVAFDFSTKVSNNLTLYAVYEINQYNITFIDNSVIYDTATASYGEIVSPPETSPSKTGYTFSHWSVEENGSAYNFSTQVTDNITLYSVYIINTYTITYELYEGEAVNQTTYTIETESFTLNNPSKTGYTFTGWTGTDYSVATDSVTITKGTTGNKTFEAHYTPIDYSITYVMNGGDLEQGKTNPSTYTIITNTITLNNPSKTGYTFVGWSENGNIPVKPYTINQGTTGNKTLEAIFNINQYTVTYMDGNVEYTTQTINYNSNASLPEVNPTKQYYTFKHWSLTENGTAYNFNTPITGNTTLYAVYEKNQYNVKFIDDGVTIRDTTVDAGTIITPETVSKTGYTFKYWSEEPNGVSYNFNTPITKNTTLYSVYEINQYNVEFYNEGSLVNTILKTYNTTIANNELPTVTKQYYKFKHWSLTENGTAYNFNTPITGNTTLYAVYEAIKYNVKFIDDGVVVEEGLVNAGSVITPVFAEKTGYTFKYWSEEPNGSKFIFSNPIVKDTTLYSVYEIQHYNVEFYNEGTLVTTIQKEYNSTLTNNETPTVSKEGYTFTYWSLDNETSEYDFDTPITSNIKLKSNYVIQGRTVTFNDENRITNVEINWGDTVSPISDQGKTGYTFSYWSLQRNGTAFDFSTPITNPTTLYAVYTINTYTITYNLNGGTTTNPVTYTVESDDFTLNNPTKNGYTFTGWTEGTEDPINTFIIRNGSTGNKTLTAHYSPITYSITYSLNGGTASNPTSYNIETETFTLNNPSKTGYTFVGWKEGTSDPVSTYTINQGTTGNLELEAIYTINTYTITYNLNGGSVNSNPTTFTIESSDITINNPIKAGYEFTGWTEGEEDPTNPFIIRSGSTENKVLTAHYSPITYSITYALDGGNLSEGITNPTSYNIETETFTLNNPSKTGYTFVGWKEETSEPVITYAINQGTTGNKIIYAVYEINQYTVTFINENETYTSEVVNYNEKASVPENSPSKTGYEFKHWSLEENGSAYNFNNSVTNNLTLYAVYEINKYKVTYVNDGETYTIQNVDYQSYASIPGTSPSKEGYTFSHWSLDQNGIAFDFSTTITSDMVLYAVYIVNNYTITYDLHGGEGVNPTTYTIETNTFTLSNPTKTGYTFIGWTNNTITSPVKTITITKGSTGNRVYEAHYTPIEYTITYDLNSGSVNNNPIKYTIESNSITLNNPTKTGYTFTGWTGTDLIEPTLVVTIPAGSTGNREYTANYEINSYTVELSVINGSGSETRTANYNTSEVFNVSPIEGYSHGNISCTNNQNGLLSGNTVTVSNISDNTVCTLTYTRDDEPSIEIIDTTNMSLVEGLIYIKLPQGIASINKSAFLSNITTTGAWTIYDKNDNEITNNSSLITTNSYIKSGNIEYRIVLLGDINQDGIVSIKDMYQSYLLYKNKATGLNEYQLKAGDYNKDGSTNIRDLYEIYKKMKGK